MVARLNLVDGAAAAWADTVNLSNYIGGLAVFTDTADKKLWGYIKAADITEALGADLFDAGAGEFEVNTGSWVAAGANTIGIEDQGAGNNALKITYINNALGAQLIFADAADLSSDLVVGQLYNLDFKAKVNAGSTVVVLFYPLSNSDPIAWSINVTAFATKNYYITGQHVDGSYIIYQSMGAGEIAYCDDISIKPVAHLGTDGVTIVSAFDGSTFNWAGMDVGFDPNDVAIALIIVIPFSIIRHPHFVVVKNLYSGAGGNIDVDHHLLFKGSNRSQGVKVKRISFSAGHDGDFIVIKEDGAAGPEICRLGSGDAWVPDSCYFKNGGSVIKPFIDVSACTLYGWTENRIIFDFDN